MKQKLSLFCLLLVALSLVSAKLKHGSFSGEKSAISGDSSNFTSLKKLCFSREINRRDCEDESHDIPRYVFNGIIRKH